MPESKGPDHPRRAGRAAILSRRPEHAAGHAPDRAAAADCASNRAADRAPGRPHCAFPGETDLRLAQDLLFFAYRDFTNAADVELEELGFGRAHHRALHFIGRQPGITVSDLLAILRITKQSLARVLGALVDQGYVAQAQGREDRRQRLLTLTAQGQALERRLFERQMDRLAPAYRKAGAAAVDGFRAVMAAIMDDAARRDIAETHPGALPNGDARDGR